MAITLRIKQFLAVLLVAFSMVAVGAGVAAAKPIGIEPKVEKFAAQASRAGLSAVQAKVLQANVDKEIAKRGGAQISANEVLWKDGSGKTVIPAPGEKQAVSMAGGTAAIEACPYYSLCLYAGFNREGTKQELFYCQEYLVADFNSYDNNQTAGTRAAFFDGGEFLEWSEPARSIVDSYDNGYKVWSVRPC